MSSKPEDTDSDHVRIDSISPHPNPGVFSSFIDESTTPPLANSSDTKIQNPYDNISYIDSTPSTPYAKPNKQSASKKDRSTLSSSTSQRSNGLYTLYYIALMKPNYSSDCRLLSLITVMIALYICAMSFFKNRSCCANSLGTVDILRIVK